jgi:GNAT superfamily N-acetyltransferase
MSAAINSFSQERNFRTRIAQDADVSAVAQLINAAFIVERIAFDGDRIDARGVGELVKKNGAFLLAEDVVGLAGCVYVEPRGERSYLGLLSVEPARQGTGLGRRLVAAAEEYARRAGCHTMDLRIISPRAESLLPFYQHLGYTQTGTASFSSDVTPKVPCHYFTMSKALS